jgi:hypothetical protein
MPVRTLLLAASHLGMLAVGFALGVYLLPILSAPDAPSPDAVDAAMRDAAHHAEFRRDLEGSDPLHYGEGRVSVGPKAVSFRGTLAPGPAYRLYLVPRFVQTKDAFLQVKAQSAAVGEVRTFDSFVLPMPASADIARYDSVVIWCEAFQAFITAAKYR